MSFARLKRYSRKIGFRFAVIQFTISVFSLLAIFVVTYFLLANALQKKDREIVESTFKRYALVFEHEGPGGLKKLLRDPEETKDFDTLLIRIDLPGGVNLFTHYPKSILQFDMQDVDTALFGEIKGLHWTSIYSKRDPGDALEILSTQLPDGTRLQVGRDTEARETVLEHFQGTFLLIMLVAMIFGLASAWFLSRRALRPMRRLINTIRNIQNGQIDARMPLSGTGDESDTLAMIFNRMLDKNQRLIHGMKNSLDFVAHDLRTPMTRLRGVAELALKNEPNDQRREALSDVLESADQILTLLNAIMDVSEANAGAMALKLEPRDLKTLIEEVVDVYSLVAQDRGIDLTMQVTSVIIPADIRLKQAIANLVDNALKYSPPGTRVEILARQSGDFIEIEVKDQGPGIPQTEQGRIWERLYRAGSNGTNRGMGLGLSLVRSIVEAHGGKVSLRSAPGKGCCFSLCLLTKTNDLVTRSRVDDAQELTHGQGL